MDGYLFQIKLIYQSRWMGYFHVIYLYAYSFSIFQTSKMPPEPTFKFKTLDFGYD